MALTTLAAVLAAMPGQTLEALKQPAVTIATHASAWLSAAAPAAGVAPSSGLGGNVPTSLTTGAIPFVNPAAGVTSLARCAAWNDATVRGVVFVYDRLWHNSGIAPATTTAQTINSVALTRPDALGANVEAWWEVYAVMGSGTPTVTLSYTNQAGTAGQTATTGALSTAMAAGRTGQFRLASGDTGVRSIQSWNQNGTTMTTGTIGLVLRRLLAVIPVNSGDTSVGPHVMTGDVLAAGMATIPDSACLELLVLPSTAATPETLLQLMLVQG